MLLISVIPFENNLGGKVVALKQIAAKLGIPKTLWNFAVDPCTEWVRIIGNPYVHNVTCKAISSTSTNSTSLRVTGM